MKRISDTLGAFTLSENNQTDAQTADKASDEDLVRAIRDGDKHSYSILVERYLDKIWRLAMSILTNEQEAEDAVQDVFLMLWQSLDKWDPDGAAKFSTWIYRVSFNKCIDIKRKRRPSSDIEDMQISTGDKTAYQQTLDHQLSDKLSIILETLPEAQRSALLLFYYEELSVEEICSKLSRSEQSVRSLLKRGRATLKEKLQYDQAFQSWDISGLSEHLWR